MMPGASSSTSVDCATSTCKSYAVYNHWEWYPQAGQLQVHNITSWNAGIVGWALAKVPV